ncbi:DNA cytosine methyltransferase [Klebsiella variicola]
MSTVVYYNEIDLHAAQHLRNLVDAGHIAPGVVDTRSIEDVTPNDLIGFNQCHFFAGIGGWSLALRRAGWPDSRPAWTASCPCQPFSAAGKGLGFADERHLWPSAHWLVGQCRPVVVFGEQSGSADANDWIDLVQADVEALGYAFGAVAFPSASVGAPHQRDRTYWVADADCQQWEGRGQAGRMADTNGNGWKGRLSGRQDAQREAVNRQAGCGGTDSGAGPVNGFWRDADWLHCRDGKWRPVRPGSFPLVDGIPARVGRLRAYGNAINIEAAAAFIKSYMAAVDNV